MMNTIKHFSFVAVFPAFLFFCMLIACSDDESSPITPAVHIVAGTVDVPVEGREEILLLTADAAVTVSSDASWCVISEKAENGISYYATMAANAETSPREAKVTVKSDNIALGRVLIKQSPKTAVEPEIPAGSMESDAKTLAAKIFAGVNIGNTLEATGGETSWGNPQISEAYIKGLKALGFNAVRIPCAWDSHLSNETTNQIDAAWLNRVSEVVGYCVANDMYAILNIHWDGGWLEDHILGGYSEVLNTKQKTLWTQIATKLNDYDEHLLFAGSNELGMNETSSTNNEFKNVEDIRTIMKYEQAFVDAVRATGGNNATRCLVVQAPATRISDAVAGVYAMPTDVVENRLMVEFHFYDPYNFCLMEEDAGWGKTFWYWGKDNTVTGSEHNATWGEEEYVKEQFAKIKAHFVDQGYPAVLGEYSAMKRTVSENQEMHNKSRAYWNEVVTREAKAHGCLPFYWETGGDINRTTGVAKEDYAIEGIMKGAAAGNYPF